MSADSECLACQACCISMQESAGWQEMTRISILVLFILEELTSCDVHKEVCSLKTFYVETLQVFSTVVTKTTQQRHPVLSMASVISVVMTTDTAFPLH